MKRREVLFRLCADTDPQLDIECHQETAPGEGGKTVQHM
jgi:hypothetical protein